VFSKVLGFFPSGAGKTTTFGMLTGEFPISAGTAYLDGYNIQTQLREVNTISPQSDPFTQTKCYINIHDRLLFVF
jgi:ABC-type multidrug transport system ATPase subunit